MFDEFVVWRLCIAKIIPKVEFWTKLGCEYDAVNTRVMSVRRVLEIKTSMNLRGYFCAVCSCLTCSCSAAGIESFTS